MAMVENIVYMLWGGHEPKHMHDIAASILSVREHMQDAKIHVLMSDNYRAYSTFFDKYVDVVSDIKLDRNISLFAKFLNFHDLLDKFDSFIFLDIDTLVKKDISPIWRNIEDISFAPYHIKGNVNASIDGSLRMDEDSFEFFKKMGMSHRRTPKSCSCFVGVIQNENNLKFWDRYKEESKDIIECFMEKVDPMVESEVRKEYGNIFNDEYYFSFVLDRMGIRITDRFYHIKHINSFKSKYFRHHPLFTKKEKKKIKRSIVGDEQ
tara:strand:+ start:9516 stop:10307 length:792 start_codon:yes stop_codon:yes gene_type:complete